MSLDRINLGDGVNLNLIESDKFKTNYIGISLIAPLGDDAAANALMLKVLRRGSANYDTMTKINRRLDFLYGASLGMKNIKCGEAQIIGLSSDMLDNRYSLDGGDIFGGTADLACDILFNPLIENRAFKKEYVDGEKTNLKDDIAAQINNKNAYAVRRCQEIMCAGEKFAVCELGTPETVDALDGAMLYAHYRKAVSTYPVEIYYVGRYEGRRDAIIAKFREMTAALERKPVAIPAAQVIKSAAYKGETVEEMEVNQGKLTLGFRTPITVASPEYPALALFNELYGGSPTSKLFVNVREKLSLCYYCRSIPEALKGIFTVACGIEVDNKQKAQDEILRQLDAVKNGEITAEELSNAKAGLISDYRTLSDSAGAMEMWYVRRNFAGVPRTPEEVAAAIDTVTADEIKAVAQSLTLDTVYFLKGTLKGEAEA